MGVYQSNANTQNAEHNTYNKPKNITNPSEDGSLEYKHQFLPERTEVHQSGSFQRAKHHLDMTQGPKYVT